MAKFKNGNIVLQDGSTVDGYDVSEIGRLVIDEAESGLPSNSDGTFVRRSDDGSVGLNNLFVTGSITAGSLTMTGTGAITTDLQGNIIGDSIVFGDFTVKNTLVVQNSEAGVVALDVTGNVEVDGNITATGNIVANGNITIGNENTDTVTIGADVISNIVPDVPSIYNLGDTGKEWNAIHGTTLNLIGTNVDTTLTIPVGGFDVGGNGTVDGLLTVGNGLNLTGELGVVGNVSVTGDQEITGSLEVGGAITSLTGYLNVNGVDVNGNSINAIGDADFGGNVSVGDSLSVGQNLQVLGSISISGLTQFTGGLEVSGNSFEANTDTVVLGKIDNTTTHVIRGTTLDETLTDITINATSLTETYTGAVQTNAATLDVNVTGAVTVDSVLSINVASPATTIDGTVTLDFNSPAITVDGSATVGVTSPAVTIDGTVTLDLNSPAVTIDGAATIDLTAPATTIDGTVTLDLNSPAITVDGATTINLTAPATTIDGTVTLDLNAPAITVDGATTIDVSAPATTIDGTVTLDLNSPAVTIDGSATIGISAPATTIDGTVTLDLNSPAVTIDSSASVDITSPTTTITGNTTLSGTGSDKLDVNISLDLDANQVNIDTIGLISIASGSTTNLTSTGGMYLESKDILRIESNPVNPLNSHVEIIGLTTDVFGNLYAHNELRVTSDTYIGSSNSTQVYFNSQVDSDIIPTITTPRNLGSATNNFGTLYAKSIVSTDTTNTTSVNYLVADAKVAGSLGVAGNTNIHGDVKIDGDCTVVGTMGFTGLATFDDITVNGVATFSVTSTVNVNSAISANGGFDTNLVPVGTLTVGTLALPWLGMYANEFYGNTNGVHTGSVIATGTDFLEGNLKGDIISTTCNVTSGYDKVENAGVNAMQIVGSLGIGKAIYVGESLGGDAYTSTFAGNVTISGDLIVNGTTTTVNSTEVTIADRTLTLNSGEVGTGVTGGNSGIIIDRGLATDYEIMFNEGTDNFRVGETGSTQAVATRYDSASMFDKGLAVWSASEYTFRTFNELKWIDDGVNGGYLNVVGDLNDPANSFYEGSPIASVVEVLNDVYATVVNSNIVSSYVGGAVVDSFVAADVRAAKYQLVFEDRDLGEFYMTEFNVMHNGTVADLSEFGIVSTMTTDPVVDVNLVAGNVELTIVYAGTNNHISFKRVDLNVAP